MLLRKVAVFMISALLLIHTLEVKSEIAFEKITGAYKTNLLSLRELVVKTEGDRLYLESKGQGTLELLNQQDDVFEVNGVPITIRFIREAGQAINSFVLTQRGQDRIFKRKELLQAAYEKVAKKIRPNGLSDAVLLNDMDSAKALIAGGIDISELDTRPQIAGPNGRRPLNWAAFQNNTAMIDLLLDAGADINATNLSGFTPLHHAVEGEAIEAIELLIKKGASLDLKTKTGRTVLEIAAMSGNQKVIDLVQTALK